MADVDVKLYRNVSVNSQYVVQLLKEHIAEYLAAKSLSLPGDISITTRNPDGSYSEINEENPIIVSCYEYEQSATEEDL
jgi:hypothetical protein